MNEEGKRGKEDTYHPEIILIIEEPAALIAAVVLRNVVGEEGVSRRQEYIARGAPVMGFFFVSCESRVGGVVRADAQSTDVVAGGGGDVVFEGAGRVEYFGAAGAECVAERV